MNAIETRERILAEYGWDAETQAYPPGRFEGEAIYAPLFGEWSNDGFGDPMYAPCDEHEHGDDECACESAWIGDVLEIDDVTRAIFPEMDARYGWATYYVSDQGFAYVTLHESDPFD